MPLCSSTSSMPLSQLISTDIIIFFALCCRFSQQHTATTATAPSVNEMKVYTFFFFFAFFLFSKTESFASNLCPHAKVCPLFRVTCISSSSRRRRLLSFSENLFTKNLYDESKWSQVKSSNYIEKLVQNECTRTSVDKILLMDDYNRGGVRFSSSFFFFVIVCQPRFHSTRNCLWMENTWNARSLEKYALIIIL